MYCKNCGKEVFDSDVFCAECGAQVGEISANEEKNIQEEELNNNKKRRLIIGTIAAIVVVAVALILIFTMGNDDEKQSIETMQTQAVTESEENDDSGYYSPEYVYVGEITDYMYASDIIDEYIEIEGTIGYISKGMQATPNRTLDMYLRDDEWNCNIVLYNYNDDDIELWGAEEGDYCTVKGYVYYDEWDAIAIDVDSIEPW